MDPRLKEQHKAGGKKHWVHSGNCRSQGMRLATEAGL